MKSPHGDREISDLQLLAAYLDGELDGQPHLKCLRRQIQEWLLEHPNAGAAALAQRRLTLLVQATQTPEPTEAAWERVLARLGELPTASPPTRRPGVVGRRLSLTVALLGTAAAIWLALFWWQRPLEPDTASQSVTPVEAVVLETPLAPTPPKMQAVVKPRKMKVEPFPVASAEEIEILRIGGADVKTLVVGDLPVTGPLLPPKPGDIALARRDADVRMDGGTTPILRMEPTADDKGP